MDRGGGPDLRLALQDAPGTPLSSLPLVRGETGKGTHPYLSRSRNTGRMMRLLL